MNQNEVDWKSGTVTYWVFDTIDEFAPFAIQLDELREDLAQISYANKVLIDVGWYPSFSADGHFTVQVIQDQDWLHPVSKEDSTTFEGLRASLNRAVQVAMLAEAQRRPAEKPSQDSN